MSIKVRILLSCCLHLLASNAMATAISPHDEKTCIEGTNFDIKRVRKLIVDGTEVLRYGKWQDKEINISSNDIDLSWTRMAKDEWGGERYAASREYRIINEEDENVQREIKNKLLNALHLTNDQVADGITFGYRLGVKSGGTHIFSDLKNSNLKYLGNVSTVNFQYREKVKKFDVTKEYWKILNPRAQKVIESVCHPKSNVCLDSSDKVFLDKYSLKRKCWSEEITYNCKTEPQHGCQHLIDQGYKQYRSACLDKQEDLCLKWKRYYVRPRAGEDAEYTEDDAGGFGSSKFSSEGGGSGFNSGGLDRSSEDSGLNSDGYGADRQHEEEKVFGFPKRGNSKNAKGRSGRNNSANLSGPNTANASSVSNGKSGIDGTKSGSSSTGDNSKGANIQDTQNQNKNNGFQKYRSIKSKGSSSGGRGGTSGSISGGGVSNGSSMSGGAGGAGNAQDGKGGEHDAVIAQSIQIDPDFLLQEGTYIPCSLTMRFVSEVAGRIQCLINQDIYGASGRVKLIERGTRAIGVYQSGSLGYGMARMHVIWTKLLTPDYKRVNLVDTQVVGRLGEAGIDGRVNSHFARRFGGALMVSLIKDVVAGVSAKHSAGHSDKARKNTININSYENTKDSTTSIVERMLDASINIPPTMYKKQGDIVGIEVGKDIDFREIYKIRVKNTR